MSQMKQFQLKWFQIDKKIIVTLNVLKWFKCWTKARYSIATIDDNGKSGF